MNPTDFGVLNGKTLSDVTVIDNEEIIFSCDSGERFRMFHAQECCESVTIEDICGDLDDIVRSPILQAYVESGHILPPKNQYDEDYEWTFYRISTINGTVTIRWYGDSNGYYSTSVSFGEWN